MSRVSEIGEMNAAEVRDNEELIYEISRIAGLRKDYIREMLGRCHGRTLIRNLFDEKWPNYYDPDILGDFNVSDARELDLIDEIRAVTDLSKWRVSGRIDRAHGRTLIRNLFHDYWPEEEEEDDDQIERADNESDLTEEEETAAYGTQGGEEHKAIQLIICQIGEMKNYHIRTNHDIGAGLRPDVLWFKLTPENNNGPALVVEIERGSSAALQKSLSSLKHANDRWPGTQLRLIVPHRRRSAVEEKLTGAFHEIRGNIKIVSIEECKNKSHYALAKILDLISKLRA